MFHPLKLDPSVVHHSFVHLALVCPIVGVDQQCSSQDFFIEGWEGTSVVV